MNTTIDIEKPLVFDTVEGQLIGFKKLLLEAVAKKSATFTINFKKNTKCDGSGLALLVECKKQCDKHGISLYLNGIGQDMKQLLEFYGIVNWFLYT